MPECPPTDRKKSKESSDNPQSSTNLENLKKRREQLQAKLAQTKARILEKQATANEIKRGVLAPKLQEIKQAVEEQVFFEKLLAFNRQQENPSATLDETSDAQLHQTRYILPFVVFSTKDNNQQIRVDYMDKHRQYLQLSTEMNFKVKGDIEIMLESRDLCNKIGFDRKQLMNPAELESIKQVMRQNQNDFGPI